MSFPKKISLLSLATALWLSPVSAGSPKKHPLYPDGDAKVFYAQQMPKNIEEVLGECSGASLDQIEQSIYINVPGFYLTLENKIGDKICSTHTFPVRVGRHREKHFGKVDLGLETPIGEGTIEEKRWIGYFRYFDDVWKKKCAKYELVQNKKKVCIEWEQVLVHRRGEVIKESSTYTDEGTPITVPIEYDKMHVLQMQIFPEGKKYYTTRCVIHATTDSHTVGSATSHCCVGLRIDDMLKLYGLVVPEQEKGKIKTKITLKLEYKVVERKGEEIVLHADIYERKPDYAALIRQELAGLELDETQVKTEVDYAKAQFGPAYVNLRKKLLADRFITRKEAGKLHYYVPIASLKK